MHVWTSHVCLEAFTHWPLLTHFPLWEHLLLATTCTNIELIQQPHGDFASDAGLRRSCSACCSLSSPLEERRSQADAAPARWRADVTKSLTALPGVAFVVGNKRRSAEPGQLGSRRTAPSTSLFHLQACGRRSSVSDKEGGGGRRETEEGRTIPGHSRTEPPTARSCRDVVAKSWTAE